MTVEDRAALKYAGLLGHRVVVVCGPANDRRVLLQTNEVADARCEIARNATWQHPVIYARNYKGNWSRQR